MNAQQFKESWDELKGYLKKRWGNFTDDDLLQIAGDQTTFNSVIVQRYGGMNDEVSKWADRWYAKWSGWYEGYKEQIELNPKC
jgi:uncharacterized protein YjbJ (UPF0337 family)